MFDLLSYVTEPVTLPHYILYNFFNVRNAESGFHCGSLVPDFRPLPQKA
jgi:hypothetical protein